MSDHVQRRFAGHIECLNRLRQQDAVIDELCDDYEEVCTWLAACVSLGKSSTDRQASRELVAALEQEICDALGIDV